MWRSNSLCAPLNPPVLGDYFPGIEQPERDTTHVHVVPTFGVCVAVPPLSIRLRDVMFN